eukprot:1147238-Pelagomonas_calceolata.AAC.5
MAGRNRKKQKKGETFMHSALIRLTWRGSDPETEDAEAGSVVTVWVRNRHSRLAYHDAPGQYDAPGQDSALHQDSCTVAWPTTMHQDGSMHQDRIVHYTKTVALSRGLPRCTRTV